MAKQHRVAPELKEQIINRIKNDGVTVAQAAKDHGVSENTIYGWIAKKVDGVSYSEIIKLKRENANSSSWWARSPSSSPRPKKRSDGKQFDTEDSPGQRAGCRTKHSLLRTEDAGERLAAQMPD